MTGKGRMALGLMRLEKTSVDQLVTLLHQSYDLGIREIDIADVYMNGQSEQKLGEAFAKEPGLRDRFFLQTKAGIVRDSAGNNSHYDFSRAHILEAVDGSLKRLNTDHVDSLLLHRPDIFADANEVGEALNELHRQGKVAHFGVSNFPIQMIEYLSKGLGELKFETGQYQIGLGHANLFADVVNTNNLNPGHESLAPNLFFYFKEKNMDLEAWSPLQVEFFKGNVLTDPGYSKTQAKLRELAEKYHSTPSGIATSFITTPWNGIRVVTGSVNIDHIKEALEGTAIRLSKADWYSLYAASGNLLP